MPVKALEAKNLRELRKRKGEKKRTFVAFMFYVFMM